METLLIAALAGIGFIVAYRTYGKWLGQRIFDLDPDRTTPAHELRDDNDYVPTKRSIVFGHHFTSIAGTGPIVGPAIAVMWGWLPALLWVLLGSIFIGAIHDFGSLVVSLRNRGKTVGEIAGTVLNRRVRILFLIVLFLALTIVLAIFGLVIAKVFGLYPQTIFPVMVQIPIAVIIGLVLHRRGIDLKLPSILALALMYLAVVFGDWGPLHAINQWFAGWPTIVWVAVLLGYSYIASVLPVWVLLQPRDYINALQLVSALGLIVVGLFAAAIFGGAPPVADAPRQPLEIVAPMVNWDPAGAPMIFPFLFITIACGAISGFHCLVSSGTSSKQLDNERDARFVGYGSMLTEGFLAVIVILACVSGLGLGTDITKAYGIALAQGRAHGLTTGFIGPDGNARDAYFYMHGSKEPDSIEVWDGPDRNEDMFFLETDRPPTVEKDGIVVTSIDVEARKIHGSLVGAAPFNTRYESWNSAQGLGAKVGAFVDGAGNFLKALGIPAGMAIALVGVLVASFAGTTLDTATRLQRYVVQELIRAIFGKGVSPGSKPCAECGYDLRATPAEEDCPECGSSEGAVPAPETHTQITGIGAWLSGKHVATILAVVVAFALAVLPAPGLALSWKTAGTGGMILCPMFGATNQLLGGLAFLVIAFWLMRRSKPVWFLALPLVFMLVMPAWAMSYQAFVASPGSETSWMQDGHWVLLSIAMVTLLLEAWMIIEAIGVWRKVRAKRISE